MAGPRPARIPQRDRGRKLDLTKVEVIIRKGFHPAIDSYSTFFENDRCTATGLDKGGCASVGSGVCF